MNSFDVFEVELVKTENEIKVAYCNDEYLLHYHFDDEVYHLSITDDIPINVLKSVINQLIHEEDEVCFIHFEKDPKDAGFFMF
jgi:hypothetical protein